MTARTILINFFLRLKERYFHGEDISTNRSHLIWEKSAIIILVGVYDIAELDEIEKLKEKIKSEFNNVDLFAVNTIENINPEKNDYRILSHRDFTVTGKPNKEISDYFSNGKTDLLVSLITKPGILERHIIRNLKAGYKVGLSGDGQINMYDIIIDSESEDKFELISQAKHYINNLNINK